ncbi:MULTISPECIES: IclR family transcriptional regulator [Actinomadura]|uniref:DNA-binding transcriptional regulator, IclR family n=1 Tax=Actinomadura madurae TaxID=1993 RepID=A0A1I5SJ63_9ACTN|nr:helix-turn-helix domain-containing protein [Actinomadura madurae]SFP70537.1 DNA-binding transcriptional regulator, IclR family [Actinomadura madurae]SPT64055.1 Acetate operon repressor [Actinomadura madurae]
MSGTQRSRRPSGRPPVGEPILDRAFRLLRAFADNGESLSLQTLAACSDLPKSTALRIANQLVRVGALERRENGEFVVGLQLLEIASLAPRGHGLRAAALPVMEDLHHVTRQHILLAVREGDEGVLVERLSATDATAVKYRVGGRIPLGETGIGVALLAYAPEEVRQARLERSAEPARLRRLLAMTRTEGVCAVTGPNPLPGGPDIISTVAAPILGRQGEALGAISLVSPGPRGTQVANRVAIRTASLAIARATRAPDPVRRTRPPADSRSPTRS